MHALSILSSVSRTLLLSPLLLILRIVSTIFLPVTVIIRHVSRFLAYFLCLPFIVLSRLEAIYIFCGTAAIVGVLMGALLGLTTHVFTGVFGLRDELDTDTASRVPSTSSSSSPSRYVPKKSAFHLASTKISLGQQLNPPISRMLFPPSIPTILEEEDEDSPFLQGNRRGRKRSMKGSLDATWIDASGDSSGL